MKIYIPRKSPVLFRLLRFRHWIKNLLIFIPLLFSGEFLNKTRLLSTIRAFVAFCLLASTVYILNDIADREKDRLHPVKTHRPVASGEVSVQTAGILSMVLLTLSFAVAWITPPNRLQLLLLEAFYLTINIFYSRILKAVPLADVTILVICYLIRLYVGGVAADVHISDWVFLTVLSGAYWLGFGKRKKEQLQVGSAGRSVLSTYPFGFLEKQTQIFCTMTMIFYALSCSDKTTVAAQNGINLVWTVPIVILICLRYNFLLEQTSSGGDPVEMFFSDRPLLILAMCYLVSAFLLTIFRR